MVLPTIFAGRYLLIFSNASKHIFQLFTIHMPYFLGNSLPPPWEKVHISRICCWLVMMPRMEYRCITWTTWPLFPRSTSGLTDTQRTSFFRCLTETGRREWIFRKVWRWFDDAFMNWEPASWYLSPCSFWKLLMQLAHVWLLCKYLKKLVRYLYCACGYDVLTLSCFLSRSNKYKP